MVRMFSLVSVLAALAIGGYLMTAQGKSQGPSSAQVTTAIDQAQSAAAAINFQQASAALEQGRSLNGTYAGTDLGGYGVVLARADASSYCLQTSAPPFAHESGPGGVPASGPC
jgi:hypothetical protein